MNSLKFLLLVFVFGSCNDQNRNRNNSSVSADTIKHVIPSDVIAKPTDSFLNTLRKAHKVHVGDFDSMLQRRIIRVLVPYSRTLFFNDKGKERGITADNFREFEQFLNQKYRKQIQNIPFTIAFIPTPRDQLISNVIKGLGDIAAGNLTATEERMHQVDFMAPKELGSVSEIVLTRKQDSPLNTVEELSGRTIHVRKSSSYYESLQRQNKILTAKGNQPIRMQVVSENLEDEDLMEMLNAGIIKVIIVDDWKARMWAQILPDIKINDSVTVHKGGYIGCAFRKDSPLLTAELEDFYYNYEKKLGSMPYRFAMYNRQVKRLQDPTDTSNAKRYREIMELFRKYGQQYNFDPLMLAAMGFQESQLNQSQRSPVGAIGVMQVMPALGKSMKVGDITVTEHNIHAGTKYMREIMTHYFQDAHFDEFNKSLFSFASYNAGPSRVASLRKLAAERGLNPDVWLNSVEIIASEKIGRETPTYVRNIVKYYYSYKLLQDLAKEEQSRP